MEIHEPIHSKSALTLYPKKCTAIETTNNGRKTRNPHAAEREIPTQMPTTNWNMETSCIAQLTDIVCNTPS